MTKFLNLDEFETSVEKTVRLNGVTHSFVPFSVGDFIDQLKEMEGYAATEELPVSEYMGHMVKMVRRAFPSISEEDLMGLSMEKLKALTDFVRGETEKEALVGVTPEEAEAKK